MTGKVGTLPDGEAQNTDAVRIKGVGDSLWVSIDPGTDSQTLIMALARSFERLKSLAVNARVVLDPGEHNGNEQLIQELGGYLRENFGVSEVTAPPREKKEAEGARERMRKRELEGGWHNRRSDVLMIAGRVRSGQKVTARKHLVLMGDVNPGGEVSAGGDILVMGSLRGTAAAGQPEKADAIILAFDFRPTQVQIGAYVAAGLPASGRQMVEFACVENDAIVVAEYMKANPFARLPWPEIR